MDKKEFLNILGIKPTKELLDNPKLKQVVDYINQKEIVLFETDVFLKTETFEMLLNNINSIETLVKILNSYSDISSLNRDVKNIVAYYNVYNFDLVEWLGEDTKVLIDKEYLKNATKEWTENVLFKTDKVINIEQDKITITKSPYSKEDPRYLDSIEQNVAVLNSAKKQGILKEVIAIATEKMSQE